MKFLRALVAEDELAPRTELATLLCQAGLVVDTAACDQTLRLAVGAGPIADVVVMSAEFGGCSGGDWLAELARRPEWHDVPVIATTSRPRSIFANALRCASVPVLAKPVDARSLRRALEQLGLRRSASAIQ